jgi:hypothetical protein
VVNIDDARTGRLFGAFGRPDKEMHEIFCVTDLTRVRISGTVRHDFASAQ